MMLTKPREIIKHTIDNFESHKYTNNPKDRGGPTKYGITIPAYKAVYGGEVTAETIRKMTLDQAIHIYKVSYYDIPKVGKLPLQLRHLVFDMGVLHGPGRAMRMVQEMAGAKVDGKLGPKTLAKINECNIDILYNDIIDRRIDYVKAIVRRDPSQEIFINGWVNRAEWFRGKTLDQKVEKKDNEHKPGGVPKAVSRFTLPILKGIIMRNIRKFIPFLSLMALFALPACTTFKSQFGESGARAAVHSGDAYCELARPSREEFRQMVIDEAAKEEDGLFVKGEVTCKQDME